MTSSPNGAATSPARRRAPTSDETILASKIIAPALPDWMVPRPRVDERIEAGRQGLLTVVSGPPGAGKTMAIASWAATHAGATPIAWATLDEYDNRPRAFWSYVVEALRQAGVEIPGTVWAPGRGRVDQAFLLRLTAAVVACGAPVVLVLDDLHLVTEPRTLNGLTRLLRNAMPHLSLVVASRSDPVLPLHRYRLAGELTEIRAGELAFSVDEAGQLMEQHDIVLPADSLAFLTGRTDGWVAALRLAAISMTTHPDPAQFVKHVAAEDSPVAGYLVEEVLNAQPAGMRSFLLRTSILDQVNADLGSELASAEPATDLPSLAQANALIRPLGGGWYRYHPLLAEVLRLKLRRESPHLERDLRRRAARWLRKNRTPAEAARQAVAGDDWQLAARIAVDELAVGQLIEPPGVEPLAEVLQGIPQDRAWSEPQPPLVTAALRLATSSDDSAGASLAVADQLLDQIPPDQEIPSRLARAVIRLGLAQRQGDLHAAEVAAADATALIGKIPADQLALHPDMGAQVKAGRGAVELWAGYFDQAAVTLTAAAAAAHNTWQRTDCLGHLALLEALRGRLGRAAELAVPPAGPGRDNQARAGQTSSCAATVAMAYVHVERNELPEARRCLRRADEILQLCPDKLIGAVACLVAARGFLAQQRPAPVAALAGRARLGWSPVPWLEQRLALAESQAHLAQGNIAPAVEAARRAGADSSLEAAAALARAWLAGGNIRAAKTALAGASAAGDRVPDQVRLQAWLAEAQLCHEIGDRRNSDRLLERALRLAESEQARLPFLMEGSWIHEGLQENPGLARAYRQLLNQGASARPGPARSRPRTPAKPPISAARQAIPAQVMPLVVESLSNREREVLQHASEMLGTAEIAAEMFVSVNTVKSHLKSIFRKLGAASRNEAVRRARQLQLL
jgi:LuxR family transcriptional regulator, maltose regulon positive regulatory protein